METVAGWTLQRGFPPGPGRGIQAFSRESPDAKSRGGIPPAPPFFRARSLPLARFCVVGRSGSMVRLFRSPPTCPDLDSHFAGAGVGREGISLQGHTTYEGFPLGGSCHRRGRMRGRFCTQPFLVEGGACRPDAFLLPPRWVSRSPPHPTRLRRPTFPPRGRLWGWERPSLSAKPPLPARPAGGRAVTGVRYRAAGQAEKKRGPLAGS